MPLMEGERPRSYPALKLPALAHDSWFSKTDVVVVAIIVLYGLAAFLFYEHSADFLGEDVFYSDCARSLLQHGYYGINGHAETNQPAGLSAMLAGIFALFGYSHAVCLRTMAALETLGFWLAYEVLRRHASRLVSASICILLISSRIYFMYATRVVFPSQAFLVASMVALLAGEKCQRDKSQLRRVIWSAVLALAVAASILIASAGVALLGAMLAVVMATALKDRRLAKTRLWKFLPALLAGVVVQGWWMHRTPAPLEWPLPGYPAPYIQQLKVKVGNYPELGMATLNDIPARIFKNVLAQSDMLAQLVLRHGVSLSKIAVVIAPPMAVALGWAYSVWEASGTGILEWYFVGYEFIYLLWPWRLEARFILPVAPLACFYLWQGMRGALTIARRYPQATGAIWCPIAILLTASGSRWIEEHWTTGFGDLPDELLVAVYLVSALVAAWMTYKNKVPRLLSLGVASPVRSSDRKILSVFRCGAYGTAVFLVAIGSIGQVAMAHENVDVAGMRVTEAASRIGDPMIREIDAALWLRDHTAPQSVIMARHLPTVYHYAQRSLVWFAPTSDSEILLQGIRDHEVDYVVVIKHSHPYYLPDDRDCLSLLLAAHGDLFEKVYEERDLQILRVAKGRVRETIAHRIPLRTQAGPHDIPFTGRQR